MKRAIVFLCGLFMVAQGLASVAHAAPWHKQPPTAQTMNMADCHMCADKHDGAEQKCCDQHCVGVADCFGTVAIAPDHFVATFQLPAAPPPAYSLARFAALDPDSRLRPPTAFLG